MLSILPLVFTAIHGLGHLGTRATQRLMTARVMWHGMRLDIAKWVRNCQHCSRGKVTSQPAAPVQPIQVSARWSAHIHVDLVGPLPVAADGSSYLLTIIDRTTRWLETVPLRNMETAKCIVHGCAHSHMDLQIWHALQHGQGTSD